MPIFKKFQILEPSGFLVFRREVLSLFYNINTCTLLLTPLCLLVQRDFLPGLFSKILKHTLHHLVGVSIKTSLLKCIAVDTRGLR